MKIKMSVKLKLMLGFGIVLLFLFIVGMVGLKANSSTNSSLVDVTQNWMPKAQLMEELKFIMANYRIWEVAYVLAGIQNEKGMQEDYIKRMDKERQTLEERMTELKGRLVTDNGKKVYQDLSNSLDKYYQISDKVISLVKNGKSYQAFILIRGDSRATYQGASKMLDNLDKINTQESQKIQQQMTDSYKRSRIINILLIIVAVATSLVTAWFLAGSISQGVSSVAQSALRIANGDLTVDRLKVNTRDEIKDMADSFNKMVDNLKHIIQQINTTSQTVAATSEELASNA
ncbi:MCP four helix bundle domain-containing protein, partial [Thermincola ferriacetica]|uniref:MCP four helix bundle domain-containing protein n=1 Tax=Thermincola ferriacetica TaxID=281456 RepID=UPI00128C1CC1